MNTRQAAQYLGISYYYLRNMRQGMHVHSGPLYTMIKTERGWTSQYLKQDLDAWVVSHNWKDRHVARLMNEIKSYVKER